MIVEDRDIIAVKDIPPRGNHCFPRWLEKMFEKGGGIKYEHPHLFDHLRHIGPIGFMEPYAASDKEIAFLVTFCAENNLRFAITGHSAHYPGATFRVVIWRPQDEKEISRLRCNVQK
jgi:hypothetical protein